MGPSQVWQPLDPSKNEIRLLLLRANDDFHAWPRAKLIKQSLNYPTHYEALSYAWGGCQPSMPLFLESDAIGEGLIDMPITAELCSALQYLRDPREDKCLWLDAVCISQSDTTEREQQIGLMHRVFHRANLVHIWLTPVRPNQELIIGKLGRLVDKPESLSAWGRVLDVYKDVESIGEIRYWSRQWVFSEMIQGRELLLHCKSWTLSMEHLKKALKYIGESMAREKSLMELEFPPAWARLLIRLTTVLPQAMRKYGREGNAVSQRHERVKTMCGL